MSYERFLVSKKRYQMQASNSEKYLGLDIGKTKLAVAVIDRDGEVSAQSQIATPLTDGGPAIIEACRQLVREMLRTQAGVHGIGIGASGVVDHTEGIIRSSGSIPGWSDIPIKADFEREFDLPVVVDNDVYAAALAEAVLGAGRRSESAVFVTISTGVGFAAVTDTSIWRGHHNLSGQIAHMLGLGGRESSATVNQLFSGAGIAEAGSSALGRELTTQEVFDAAASGSGPMQEIIATAIAAAATVVACVQTSLDPEIIILGGSVAVQNPSFVAAIADGAASRLKAYARQLPEGPKVVTARLGSDAGVIGSAWLCVTE
jgi:glucokinase